MGAASSKMTFGWRRTTANDKVINITEEDPEIIHALLQTIYTSDYDIPNDAPANGLCFHVNLYIAGEYHQAPCARDYALYKLQRIKLEDVESQAFTQATQAIASDLPSTTGKDLHEQMVKMVMGDVQATEPDGFIEAVMQVPDHGLEVAKALLDELRKTMKKRDALKDVIKQHKDEIEQHKAEMAEMAVVWCTKCKRGYKYADDAGWLRSPQDHHCMACGQKEVLISRDDDMMDHFFEEECYCDTRI